MTDSPKETAARMSKIIDATDNDPPDEGIQLMAIKERELTKDELKYLNSVRRGKLIKSLLFMAFSQLPLGMYMLLDYLLAIGGK